MNRKKKIYRSISVLLCFVLMLSGINSFAAYSDVAAGDDCYEALLRLTDLGVINGNPDGSFNPKNNLTRAEFAKMIVAALDKQEAAAANGIYTTYSDVPEGHWATGYINYVSSNTIGASSASKIMVGYSNGNFGPEDKITYAEVCTVMMRMLGYEQTDVGYFWPDNYMSAALASGLSKNYENVSSDYPVDRAMAVILMDRALFMNINRSTQDILLEKIGYSVLDDCVVTSTEDFSPSLNKIRLSDDKTYSYKSIQKISPATVLDYTVFDDDGDIICIKKADKDSLSSLSAIVTNVTDNQISYTSALGGNGLYKLDNSFVCYTESGKTTFSQAKNQITVGTSITFYGEEEGDWTFVIIDSGNTEPVIASKDYSDTDTDIEGMTINYNGLIVYRDGESATIGDICKNDVVYYNTTTNIMDVYSKKVTGIYTEAFPSKAYVSGVSVAGNTYTLQTSMATKKLDASPGSYQIGDRITLLLGKNDEVADVVQLTSSEFDMSLYGVLLSCYTQTASSGENEGKTEYIAEMFMADGQERSYVVSRDYSGFEARLCKLDFQESGLRLEAVRLSSQIGSGVVNKAERTIGSSEFLKQGSILQINSSEKGNVDVSYIDFDTMDITKINTNQVVTCVTANSFGDIGILVVKDVFAAELYEFGLITRISDVSGSSGQTYTILSPDSVSTAYTVNFKADAKVGVPVMYRIAGGRVSDISRLYLCAQANFVNALEGGRIKLGSKIYRLSDDVIIYQLRDQKYQCISLEDLQEMKVSGISLYSDTNGGVIRVITVTSAL